jgi:hypothetical protein
VTQEGEGPSNLSFSGFVCASAWGADFQIRSRVVRLAGPEVLFIGFNPMKGPGIEVALNQAGRF